MRSKKRELKFQSKLKQLELKYLQLKKGSVSTVSKFKQSCLTTNNLKEKMTV